MLWIEPVEASIGYEKVIASPQEAKVALRPANTKLKLCGISPPLNASGCTGAASWHACTPPGGELTGAREARIPL